MKTTTMIAESGRQDDVDALRRKYQEEAASMQHIMKGLETSVSQEKYVSYAFSSASYINISV